ncbi:MED6-domain-containing protein, partial [Punctularia strigosozonata HHB-11173 SS5]|uniref:MED6-domain-containing protein n=1 Tax=Punctularia strigosozonata (strain HHB-11173) TaxID=741275 RepID=UPI0004416C01
MDLNDLHPPDDSSSQSFIWHEWLQANGPLTTQNAFEYFATSRFYDKQSNNQVLRMQTMHTGQIMTPAQEEEELKRFTGVEFALVHAAAPTLFIIHKRERLSPSEVRPLAVYFIMNNRIYPSPDVYAVVANRLLTTVHSLQSSLDTLRRHRPAHAPRTGFIWPI